MIRSSILVAFLLVCPAAVPAASGEAPRLALPVDCRPGVDCFVQNYVDTAPGADAGDFTCGPLSYDGHTGTDFRLTGLAAMRRGVAVRAVAPGRVVHVRDGVADTGLPAGATAAPGPSDCGNGVFIAHEDGWSTHYCHMKQGSLLVARGQQVEAGAPLGQVGLSGRTAFPHLHFTVRHRRVAIDPFTARAAESGCGARPEDRPLWSAATASALAYRASGLLLAGFADREPSRSEAEAGAHDHASLPSSAPALVFWVEIFGLRQGDVEVFRLADPDGRPLVEHRSEPADRNRAVQYRYIGKRRGRGDWPSGTYTGSYRLLRDGAVAIGTERRLVVE